jgi:hypothetical protein
VEVADVSRHAFPADAQIVAEAQAVVVTSSAEYGIWNTGMSPNGRWICFQATKGMSSRIGFVKKTGGRWHWITDTNSWADKPRWSTDPAPHDFPGHRTAA